MINFIKVIKSLTQNLSLGKVNEEDFVSKPWVSIFKL